MKKSEKVRCKICQGDKFFVKTGYNICEKCGMSRGHVLGFFDQKEYERQKSIYQRKYNYEK